MKYPTAADGTNTTQIATTAFIQDLLLNAPTSSSSTLSGAIWTSATTGTLDGTHTHRLVLEGLFGPVYKATSTSDLIDKGQLASFRIKC